MLRLILSLSLELIYLLLEMWQSQKHMGAPAYCIYLHSEVWKSGSMYDLKATHQIPFSVSDTPVVCLYPATKSVPNQNAWLAKTVWLLSYPSLDWYETGSSRCRAKDSHLAACFPLSQITTTTCTVIRLSRYNHLQQGLYFLLIPPVARMSESYHQSLILKR